MKRNQNETSVIYKTKLKKQKKAKQKLKKK